MKKSSFADSVRLLVIVISLLLSSAPSARAVPGGPDVSFGLFGSKIDGDPNYSFEPRFVEQQFDGKLLVVGTFYSSTNTERRLLIRRYHVNGSLDIAFGYNGFAVARIAQTLFVPVYGRPTRVVVQTDGKIVVAGGGPSGLTVWRFTSTGELDATFSNDGMVPVQSSVGSIDLAYQQGKYIVLLDNNTLMSQRLIRLNSNGSLDYSFGTSGQKFVTSAIITSNIVVDPTNGKFIAGTYNSDPAPALWHFNANGTFDTAFGVDGRKSVPLSVNCGTYTMTPHWFGSLVRLPDGKIIAAGHVDSVGGCMSDSCYGNPIVRLLPNATLDTSYGSGGYGLKCDGHLDHAKIKLSNDGTNAILADLGATSSISSVDLFRRFNSAGLQNLIIADYTYDFLSQRGDGKIVALTTAYPAKIKLSRFLP